MPLTNEGLKVKEELSASLRDGRYLCLNGKLASPPLGAEPSASSSLHPCSAIPGPSADHHCPQNTYSLGSWQGSEEGARLFGEGLALAPSSHLYRVTRARGPTPALCQTHPVPDPSGSQSHCLCLHPILAAKTHICRRKEMAQLHRDIRSPV